MNGRALVFSSVFVAASVAGLGCESGPAERRPPRRPRPHEIHPEQEDPLLSGRARANDAPGGEDRWSMDAMLRSGDPDRPNVMVELAVVDQTQARRLDVGVSVSGSFVHGVVALGGSVRAGSNRSRARTSSSTFVVVQAGSWGSISLTDDARSLCGPWAGIQVGVLGIRADGTIEVELAPYVSPTSRRGEQLRGATRVRLPSGASMVIGGFEQSESRSTSGWGHTREHESSRRLIAVLTVRIIG